MKIFKKILLGLLIFIALVLIVALFVPKSFDSKSQIIINKPKDEVFAYIVQVKNQDHFGVWQLSEPTMKKHFEGADGTVGFKYHWDGEKMGKGTQTITAIVPGQSMESELDFGFGEPAQAYFITNDAGAGQTEVTWGIKGKTPYPFNIMNLCVDMGKDFEQGLKNLKDVLERP
jgi:hypothetical protein